MELTGAAALRRSLASASLAVLPGERRRRRAPGRVSCVGRGCGASFADEAHLRYYEAAPRKAVEAAARDLSKLRAMGLVAGDAAKEKILSEATELLFQELSQMKDAEDGLKKKEKQKEDKAAMKAQKKQQKEAKKAAMKCGVGSSESSESECEEDQSMTMSCVGTSSMMPGTEQQGMVMSMSVPQIGAVQAVDFDKGAMKAIKKKEKEQKKAAKKALKMKKEEEKRMAMLNPCKDEDSSSCSSESSDSDCEEKILRMSRCATITAPRPPPASTVSPITVPQIPDGVATNAQTSPGPATAVQCTTATSIALVENPSTRIEVCMGGKCKKSGALTVLQEFEKEMGTGGAVVGCKCLGKCGQGPNVRLQNEGSVGKEGLVCTGVGLDDVGAIVASSFAWGRLGI